MIQNENYAIKKKFSEIVQKTPNTYNMIIFLTSLTITHSPSMQYTAVIARINRFQLSTLNKNISLTIQNETGFRTLLHFTLVNSTIDILSHDFHIHVSKTAP